MVPYWLIDNYFYIFFFQIRGLFSRLAKAKRQSNENPDPNQTFSLESQDQLDYESLLDLDNIQAALVISEAETAILNDFVLSNE